MSVFRDFDKDRKRTGDKVDTGSFGLNQHHGSDAEPHEHRQDQRGLPGRPHGQGARGVHGDRQAGSRAYVANRAYKFVTTILDAGQVLRT